MLDWDECEKFIGTLDMSALYADEMRARAKTEDLQLFWIVNTADRKQFVIAKEAKFARILSARSGHIRERANGEIYRAGPKFFENNPGFGSVVRRAMKDRIPGVIEKKGEHGLTGEKVYSPIHGI